MKIFLILMMFDPCSLQLQVILSLPIKKLNTLPKFIYNCICNEIQSRINHHEINLIANSFKFINAYTFKELEHLVNVYHFILYKTEIENPNDDIFIENIKKTLLKALRCFWHSWCLLTLKLAEKDVPKNRLIQMYIHPCSKRVGFNCLVCTGQSKIPKFQVTFRRCHVYLEQTFVLNPTCICDSFRKNIVAAAIF